MNSYKETNIETLLRDAVDFATTLSNDPQVISTMCVTQAVFHLSNSIGYMTFKLGTAGASTNMGALECVGKGLDDIAKAIRGMK